MASEDLIAIPVTQEHINRGERWEPCFCPLALAMIDALGLSYVSVETARATSRSKQGTFFTAHRSWLLEQDAKDLIHEVDSMSGNPQPCVVHIRRAP